MAGILDSVNQRTQLVGQNRLELLLFSLVGRQKYGINVFKVREVLPCPKLTEIPKRQPVVRGVAHIRGHTISIIDLSLAIGGPQVRDLSKAFVIIAEYNRNVQGFLVNSVERIVNTNWENMAPPPSGAGISSYLTAVTQVEGQLIEVIDVEKVLAELIPIPTEISEGIIETSLTDTGGEHVVLIADDSSVARNQIKRTIEQLGVKVIACKDGREMLNLLQKTVADGKSIQDEFLMLISDIEMPEMDGYTLTAEIRHNAKLAGLYVVLHTSLSGVFNQAMVQKVGANAFIAKFQPDELALIVQEQMRKKNEQRRHSH